MILCGLLTVGLAVPSAYGQQADRDQDTPIQEEANDTDSPPELTEQEIEFFEKNVRPVLVTRCYECHSAESKILMGGLRLDSQQGVAAGGDSGPVIDHANPSESLLLLAVSWEDDNYQMPPDEKLNDKEITALTRWVEMGAPDPRTSDSAPVEERVIDIDEGRKWWSFQPVQSQTPPAINHPEWAQNRLDHFIAHRLDQQGLSPSDPADRETLIRRVTLDLTGLRPTYDEIQAFVADTNPAAYSRLVERLLDSPRYGERWGRYWLDVVRYAEDNYTREATTPPFPFAWRYRDWVIDAINRDLPYDQFVKRQLAADLMPELPRTELVALGFLGTAPNYHKDGRLSRDVIQTLYMDDWDERLDTVTRGFLGLTVACARCHDHKFDPVPTEDYYRLASVFASTVQAPRTLNPIDPEKETGFMVDTQQIFYRSYVANLLRDDPGSKPEEAREKVIRYTAEMEQLKQDHADLKEEHPAMFSYLDRLARRPRPYPDQPSTDNDSRERDRRRGRRRDSGDLFHAVFDAGFWVDGSDPDLTMLEIRPGQPHDLQVMIGGNVSKLGEPAPRGFPQVLSTGDAVFPESMASGRLELANRIFQDASGLSARVIVNRVWGWHFGKPLVATPSDFGRQGQPPTHPQLLDDLAARFIQNNYSLKWLHREILLSATYQQASQPRSPEVEQDPDNRLLWRMNPRRLQVEAYRDCLLQATGDLDLSMGGRSDDLDRLENHRRTVYGRVSRGRQAQIAKLYDFPVPTMHNPQRETTTSPLQQLFVMNSDFMQQRAEALVQRVAQHSRSSDRVVAMYHHVFGRDPDESELQRAQAYLAQASEVSFAQALLSTNEVIFWP